LVEEPGDESLHAVLLIGKITFDKREGIHGPDSPLCKSRLDPGPIQFYRSFVTLPFEILNVGSIPWLSLQMWPTIHGKFINTTRNEESRTISRSTGDPGDLQSEGGRCGLIQNSTRSALRHRTALQLDEVFKKIMPRYERYEDSF
jgi:hypothetical protein